MTAATTTPTPPPAKRDPINKRFFDPLEILERWSGRLFYVTAVVSFLPIFVEKMEHPTVFDGIQIAFVLLVITLFIAGLVVRLWLMPEAHDARRTDLLSHAYELPLTPEQTEGYYNNGQTDPLRRVGVMTMENAFFTREILRSMARWERGKTSVYTATFLGLLMYRGYPAEVWGIVAQAVFSEQIFSRFLRVEWLRRRADRVYDELYALFQSEPAMLTVHARAVWGFAFYEAGKDNAAITLSTKIFRRRNPALSEDWQKIRGKLKL
jgi:hypothetical protein